MLLRIMGAQVRNFSTYLILLLIEPTSVHSLILISILALKPISRLPAPHSPGEIVPRMAKHVRLIGLTLLAISDEIEVILSETGVNDVEMDEHWRRQSAFCGLRLFRYDFVGYQVGG